MTQEELSKAVGKSRSTIANCVRLLNMPEKIQDYLKKGELSIGQAKAIGAIESEEEMLELAERVVKEQISVRAIEKYIANKKDAENNQEKSETPKRQSVNYLTEMEISLKESQIGRASCRERVASPV